jgi:hypothetical protein
MESKDRNRRHGNGNNNHRRPNQDRGVIHVYPINDAKQHFLYSTNCECNPTIEKDKGTFIVTHNSFDGREGVEMANEILTLDSMKPKYPNNNFRNKRHGKD